MLVSRCLAGGVDPPGRERGGGAGPGAGLPQTPRRPSPATVGDAHAAKGFFRDAHRPANEDGGSADLRGPGSGSKRGPGTK